MIYVDSNVFVYPVLYDASRITRATQAVKVLRRIARGEIKAATSALTWDEVVWVARKLGDVESASVQGRSFIELPNLRILPVTIDTVTNAQELIEKIGLAPRDSLHASAAITNRIEEIVSDDRDFDRVEGLKRIGIAAAAEARI